MNSQEKIWNVAKWVGIFLSVFLVVISIKEILSLKYIGRDQPVFNSISVTGKGEIITKPNIATFTFGVTETAKSVDIAQSKASDRINVAIDAVKSEGVKKEDIKTTSYNINPKYEYQQGLCTVSFCKPGIQVLTGYEVSQNIEVRVKDIEKAGAIFSKIGTLNVDNINSLAFSVDDIEKVRTEARDLAIQDAKIKSKELSKQLGVKIVKITSFYDNSAQPPFYGRESFGGDAMNVKTASAPVPEIPVGEQKVISNVTITYEIK